MSGTYLSKIPVLVVALVIGIVLVTSAVVPLASDYSEAKTFTNKGYYNISYDEVDSDVTTTVTWDHTAPTKITVNDTVIDLPTTTNPTYYTVLCGDDWVLRYSTTSPNNIVFWATNGTYIRASVPEANDMTVICSAGSVTATTTSDETKSGTYTSIYVISKEGDYVMKNAGESVYLKGDSNIVAMGTSNVGTNNNQGVRFEGNIDDGITGSFWYSTGGDGVISNVEYDDESVSGYVDLYTLSELTATATVGETTADLSYTYFIVPAKVTADPDNPAAYKNLVKVVPLMAFIMLVVAAASMVYLKNKD